MLRGINGSGGGVPTSGSGAAGYLAKWTAATTLGGSTTTGATASPFVNATGNVGIGTASPAAKLDIYGTSANPTSVGSAANAGILRVHGSSTQSLIIGNSTLTAPYSTYTAWLQAADEGSGVGYNIAIAPLGGNVGIGTASPGGRLTVAGGFINPAAGYGVYQVGDHLDLASGTGKNVRLRLNDGGTLAVDVGATSCDFTNISNYGLKLQSTAGNTDPNTLDCYAETDVAAGYTLSGVTTTSGAITVAIRATRIGRTMTFAVSIAPAGGASLTFAAAWYLTMTGVSAPAFAGSLAVSSNDATVTRGAAWVNAVAGPTVYGSAAVLGANVSLFLNGTI